LQPAKGIVVDPAFQIVEIIFANQDLDNNGAIDKKIVYPLVMEQLKKLEKG